VAQGAGSSSQKIVVAVRVALSTLHNEPKLQKIELTTAAISTAFWPLF
jgi:Ran GTPase-activating protein (RanGAP) involved in mRNA processing and transport